MQRSPVGYLGASIVVRGAVSGIADVRVDGKIEGDVAVEGLVEVGGTGVLVAPVRVESLVVEGHVRGDVIATDSVAVRNGGCIDGNVHARRVSIDDGGELHGRVDMDVELPDSIRRRHDTEAS